MASLYFQFGPSLSEELFAHQSLQIAKAERLWHKHWFGLNKSLAFILSEDKLNV